MNEVEKEKKGSKKTDQRRLQRDSKVHMSLIAIILLLILVLGVILLT